MKCTVVKTDGTLCRAQAKGGGPTCRWHSPKPEDQAAHQEQSRRGGEARAGKYGAPLPQTDPLAADAVVAGFDLTTAGGLKELMAATMRALTRLPLDARVATCLGQIATTQRAIIVESDFEQRMEAVEAANASP